MVAEVFSLEVWIRFDLAEVPFPLENSLFLKYFRADPQSSGEVFLPEFLNVDFYFLWKGDLSALER